MSIFLATAAYSQILYALDQSRPFSAHWTLAGWQAELAQTASQVWCAEKEGQVVGFIAVRGVAGQYEILNLAVAADQARLGIASTLVSHVLDSLAAGGTVQISLEVSTANQPALALYRKIGFSVVGVRKKFYPDGADGLIMEKKL